MDIFHDVRWKRSDCYVSTRTIYTAILYIPQFPARCREYVGEIYELECYYHPPIFFFLLFLFLLSPSYSFFFLLSSFPFSFSFFHSFFNFSLYSIPTTIDGVYLSFYQNIFIWDLVLKDLLKGIQWCNQNLIWFFYFLSYSIFS
jgi:hypothetical protein